MKTNRRLAVCTAVALVLTLNGVGSGQRQLLGRVVRAFAPGGNVNLPYNVTDSQGNQWNVYQGGWVQMQGNQPLFSQGGMLNINGNQPNMRNNSARLDEKTGELVFENMNAQNGFTVTRRVLIDKENCYVRYTDILKNNQAQEQTVAFQIQSNMNFGMDQTQNINDPRKKDNVIAFTCSNGNGKSVVEMLAGKGAKLTPTFNCQQGNTFVQGNMSIPVPGNKEVAVVHIHGIVNTADQAVQFVTQFRESKMLLTLSPELRKMVVNFTGGSGFIGDREILRGDLFDVVEIRGGDTMRGTLKEPAYALQTFYGNINLPSSRVIGLINVGEYRPRQLLITSDGEIFGGKLGKDSVSLELTSGQTTQIPLSQVTRVGYRKRPDEAEEWAFDKPFVSLRSGDRIAVEMPAQPIEVVTRYGPLKVDPKSIAGIAFQNEEHGVHDVTLTDGSKFAGLVSAPEFEMKLSGGGTAGATQPSESQSVQTVHFPTSAIARIQFAKVGDDVDTDESATLKLANDDLLVGSLINELKLDTAFDTLSVKAGEIKKLSRARDGATDVQVTLWDSSVVSGQLQDPSLKCQLASGVTLSIPVALLDEYNQPQPQPAATIVEKIKATVGQLNADDWKARDRAEAELTSMGPIVVAVLKQMRPTQPPEAQQRIDQILVNVAKKK